MQHVLEFLIIPYLYDVQHVSGHTPPIIRHTVPDNVHQLHVQQPFTYKKNQRLPVQF
jgi:hypothetical protein